MSIDNKNQLRQYELDSEIESMKMELQVWIGTFLIRIPTRIEI